MQQIDCPVREVAGARDGVVAIDARRVSSRFVRMQDLTLDLLSYR